MATDLSLAVRAEVAGRAHFRCEYCLIHEDDAGFPDEVDHILSRKHGGTSELGNLAYSCLVCNRLKGSAIATSDAKTRQRIRLFHPREDRWDDRFRVAGFVIEPLTSVGAATVRLLRMNSAARVAERRILAALGRYP